jgi:hypothetical protein
VCVCRVSLGDVTDVMVAVDRDTKESKGFAFVVFAQEAQVREGRGGVGKEGEKTSGTWRVWQH